MIKHEEGTILIIIVGFVMIFISIFICAFNIYYVLGEKQYLRNAVDQSVLVGTNEIDLVSYYKNGVSEDIQLSQIGVQKNVKDYLESIYLDSEIVKLEIQLDTSEVSVYIQKKVKLPIGIGINFIKISASASAKLQVN